MLHQRPVDLHGGCGRSPQTTNLVTVLARPIKKLLGRLHSLGGSDYDRLSKEIKPSFPVTGQTHVIEQLVVILAVRLEIEA